VEDPNRKVPDLYFKVVDPKLQVADLNAEVEELRSGGIPQFNPCRFHSCYGSSVHAWTAVSTEVVAYHLN